MKTLDELAADLIFWEEGKPFPVRQYEHAKKMLYTNPKLVATLQNPVPLEGLKPGDPLSRAPAVFEAPLGQQQPLNAWRNQGAWAEKLTVRAVATAGAIVKYRRAVVISLYNERAQKNELVIAKTTFRAVCKLIWFRFTMWARKHLNRE